MNVCIELEDVLELKGQATGKQMLLYPRTSGLGLLKAGRVLEELRADTGSARAAEDSPLRDGPFLSPPVVAADRGEDTMSAWLCLKHSMRLVLW